MGKDGDGLSVREQQGGSPGPLGVRLVLSWCPGSVTRHSSEKGIGDGLGFASNQRRWS